MSATSSRGLRWVFLDRDGTINAKPPPGEYVTAPAQIQLLDGAARAIHRLNDAGIWVGVVTNQRGVALGQMSPADLDAVHRRLLAELARGGAHVDAIYVCPHQQGTCVCRKPQPGLLLRAREDVGDIDFARAALVGDSPSDVQAGNAVGATTVLLASEGAPAAGEDRVGDVGEDHVAPSLAAAVGWLLGDR
jgi:D-glycero-D-manno-heptose 1,7-bisphosphate phosphatase